ncbi:MAG: FtsX-like permease family protein [Abitibacteriaceae bacterium]|nr:FtsX-like permease family protein [Abditibacteriaceae bacterium]MBV9867165.1 FtsX-like permease family protein [Abditibacteriaceae bacterium]
MAVAGPAPKIERQISLPFNQALKIAMRNITIRLGRALITGAGTMLGIAFLMSVFTGTLVQQARGTAIAPEQLSKNTWLVVMSLLVSVVGITNSMLMNVTERYKEIGTMKCLGALDNFIVRLFLLESGVLGFFGSLTGALIGALFMLLTGIGVLGRLNWVQLLIYLGICVGIGTVLSIVAAIPPAWRAANMHPADAMRTEI